MRVTTRRTSPSRVLANAAPRLLVVEDECLIAFSMVDDLVSLGYTVVGPAFTAEAARRLAATVKFDAALVDINMSGDNSFEAAEIMLARGIPFVFATGYPQVTDPRFKHIPVLVKPFRLPELKQAVEQMLAGAAAA